jgi:hypothetical protein
MPATVQNLIIDARGVVSGDVQLIGSDGQPLDLTGYTARASVKAKYSDPAPLAVFICTVDGPEGTVSWSMSKTETAKLQGVLGECVWDLWLDDPDGGPDPILRGSVRINQAVS